MSHEFDPLRAAREELSGLTDVHRLMLTRARDTERQLAEAEADHNGAVKIEAFVRELVVKAGARVARLEHEAENSGRS